MCYFVNHTCPVAVGTFQPPLFCYEINSTLTMINSDWFDLSSHVPPLTHAVTDIRSAILFCLTPEIPPTSTQFFLSRVLYVMLILRRHRQSNHHALRNSTDERQVFLNVNRKSPWLRILATVAWMSVSFQCWVLYHA